MGRLIEAVALDRLGLAHWRSGQLQPAATYLTRSLAVARRTGSRAGQMSVLGNLGGVSAELGMLQQAADHFTAALALKPEPATGAGLLDGLGEVSYNRGRLDQALDHLTEALARFQEIGYRGGQSDTLRNLAGVHTDAGRYDQALELAGEAL
jgi:tetratricopeptide (TPR) repeat protein